MASEWQTVRIEDIADRVAMGPFGSSIKVETFVSDGIPIISGQHLHGFKIDDASGYNFITKEHADRLKNANVQRGDLIFTHAGNIGQVSLIPETSAYDFYVISQRQFYLRCNRKKVIPEYLVAYFKSREGQHKLLANSTSVGVPSIARPVTYLRSIEILLPPLNEQRAIAHILGTLDDKIELNRKMNETLEAMARATFKAWFVDFEPVRAKMEGRWQRGQSLPGLPVHLYDLFPDRLVDSELGDIPEGWEVGMVGKVCEFAYGKALKADQREPGSVPVMGSNGQVGVHNQALLKGPGIIVGRKGNPGIVTWVNTDFYPIDTTFYVVPSEPEYPLTFLCYALENLNLASFGADSAVPGLNRQIAYGAKLVIPGSEVLEIFTHFVAPIREQQHTTGTESLTLSALCDILLPKLISGELRIKDAESFNRERCL